MTNYGLPLQFKAVEIATGKDVGTNKLIIDPSDGQWYACYGGDTIRFDEEWVTEIQLYQSTGHTDANGAEVFFGDVLANIGKLDGYIENVIWEVIYERDGMILWSENAKATEYASHLKSTVVIGNIHTPTAELERRAQEVRA